MKKQLFKKLLSAFTCLLLSAFTLLVPTLAAAETASSETASSEHVSHVSSAVSAVSSSPEVSSDTETASSEISSTASSEQQSTLSSSQQTVSSAQSAPTASAEQPSSSAGASASASSAAEESAEASASESAVLAGQDNTHHWSDSLETALGEACMDLIREDEQGSALYFTALGSAGKSAAVSLVTSLTAKLSDTDAFFAQSELQRAYDVLNLTFCGYSASGLAGNNLLELLCQVEDVQELSAAETAFLLLALDCVDYEIPSSSSLTRSGLYRNLLDYQHSDGGFGSSRFAQSADSYSTALALSALTPYQNRDSAVSTAIDNGLEYLSSQQNEQGAILADGAPSCRATAQTLVALSTLGVDLKETRFAKNNTLLTDALQLFLCDDGYSESAGGTEADLLATQEVILALVSVKKGGSPYLISNQLSASEEESPASPSDTLFWWILAGAVVLLLLAGGFWLWLRFLRPAQKKRRAEQARQEDSSAPPDE